MKWKKYTFVFLVYFFGTIISCCPGEGTTTYNTIETAGVLLFSFDENGIYPHLENFNPTELGISVFADSLSSRTEIAANFSSMDKAYACTNPNEVYFTNTIDSLNVTTVYDFDSNHPAGSSVNDVLLLLDDFGETFQFDISKSSSIAHKYKFSVIPQNDSLQFIVTGRIVNKESFTKTTKLVILE